MIKALVFDFDGLILETEMPIFLAWQELFRRHNCELTTEQWLHNVGTAEETFNPVADLQRQAGRELELTAELERRLQRETELIIKQTALPGVREYLEDARQMGLKVGLASSSSCDWVTGHLKRLDLLHFFDAVVARDDVAHTKPDPELYRKAVEALEVQPQEAVAFEDSRNGLLAARQAGLYCVAVPNELTRSLSLDEADLLLSSLNDLPLQTLLEHLAG